MNQVSAVEARQGAPVTRASRIVAVASGKGGVGKTWLSCTLSHALARAGRKVLLFDGDIGLANVDVQLGLVPQDDLGAVLTGQLPLEKAVAPYAEGGFHIIAGMSGSVNLSSLPKERLTGLFAELRALSKRYDVTVLDIGAGIDGTVRDLAMMADSCLVITTGEPTSLTDAYAFIKYNAKDCPPSAFRVVVNMADSIPEGERTYNTLFKACQGFLKLTPPLAGIVRRDRRVADAIRHQTPLMTRFPTTEAALDIEKVAGRVLSAA